MKAADPEVAEILRASSKRTLLGWAVASSFLLYLWLGFVGLTWQGIAVAVLVPLFAGELAERKRVGAQLANLRRDREARVLVRRILQEEGR